jgi:tRNA pseudouridine38-40 synthase
MRYFIRLSYDGTPFVGWQRQPNGISVQELLEENLGKLLREPIQVVGCGRTDTGVHARQYFAHFDWDKELPENIEYKLNALVGNALAIHKVYTVAAGQHARFSALKRTYKYFVHFDKDPFIEAYSFHLHEWKPDLDKMNHLAGKLVGEHDFSAFEKKGSDNKNSFCLVQEAYWEPVINGMVFTITANRFLRNMVRSVTGSLLSVALNKMTEEHVMEHFERKAQLNVKVAVPAKGLFLWNIEYEPGDGN